jgi:flagellar hook assembly protein FlgD
MSNPVTSLNANTPVTAASTSGTPTVESSSGQTLTQADFLKIMVAQFTQQDPLSSGDGSSGGSSTSDYVNQLMSMTNLTTLQTLSGQEAQGLAAQLPGDTVTIDNNGAFSTGTVQSARVNGSDGGVYFTVGGTEYPTSDLYSIAAASTAATTPATTTPTTTTP